MIDHLQFHLQPSHTSRCELVLPVHVVIGRSGIDKIKSFDQVCDCLMKFRQSETMYTPIQTGLAKSYVQYLLNKSIFRK